MKQPKQTPPGPGGTQTDDWWQNFAVGENPNGFRAITANGVATDRSPGENHEWMWGPPVNGKRWTMPDPMYPPGLGLPVGAPGKPGSGRSGNRNRSGE